MATLGTIVADFTTSLASAIAVGGTTGTLQSATDDDGVALPSGRYFFTIDGANANKEHISCQLSGTSLSSIKSVSRQGVETTGTARAHRLGATVTITDYLSIKLLNDMISGVATLDADVPLGYDATASITTDNQLATKAYVDGVAISGAPDAATGTKGITKLSVAAASAANPIAVGTNDPRIAPNNYGASAAGTDTYAITLSSAPSAYAAGQVYTFKADVANTGAATLNVNSLGAVTIKKNVSEDLATNDIVANQVVTVVYDGTNMQLERPVPELVPVTRTYVNSGSPHTWTKPTGLKYVEVEVQAAGGGGGGADAGTGETSAGNGGGAGAYSRKRIAAASLGATETVTVGAVGAGGASTGGNGSTGGTASFGSHVSCTGGAGGTGDDANGWGSFAAGGTATGGDLNVTGGVGQPGNTGSTSSAKSEGSPGHGGASYFGGASNGTAPYGAGGSGAYSSDGATSGTDGGAAIVIVTEYYS